MWSFSSLASSSSAQAWSSLSAKLATTDEPKREVLNSSLSAQTITRRKQSDQWMRFSLIILEPTRRKRRGSTVGWLRQMERHGGAVSRERERETRGTSWCSEEDPSRCVSYRRTSEEEEETQFQKCTFLNAILLDRSILLKLPFYHKLKRLLEFVDVIFFYNIIFVFHVNQ